jgi:Phage tail tube protein, GTA-gp10
MANRHRGEIAATLDGKTYVLCLTLGALAELEHAYGGEDILALAQRFEQGRITATDALRVIGAGLRGGGNAVTDDELRQFRADNGAAGFMAIVVDLLKATFAAD